MLEPEPEPKNLDAWNWSQNRSLQFAFRLHSPAFGSLQPAGYERLLESHGRRQKDSQPKRAKRVSGQGEKLRPQKQPAAVISCGSAEVDRTEGLENIRQLKNCRNAVENARQHMRYEK